MNFEILTLFPAMLEGFFSESILGRARESGAVRVACTDIRAYTRNKHRRVDDTPYGGGYGMVLACQPVVDCLRAVKSRLTGSVRTIYLSPQGGLFTHRKAKELASYDNLVLLCGHYEGVDERILELEVDEEKIVIVLKDKGPGIPDIDKAMEEGWSTASPTVRARGFGAGMGLPNMKRNADEMDIQTTLGVGTTVTMVIYIGGDGK